MDVLPIIAVVVLLACVVVAVGAPLRRGRTALAETGDEARRADLEAAKETKYREIRDAEMDFRTGKLSEQDWRLMDRELRAEAVDILRRIDDLGPAADGAPAGAEPDARPARPAPKRRDKAGRGGR